MRTAPPITMGKPPSSPTPTGTGGKSRWRSSLRYRRPPSHVCGPHAPVGPPRSGPPRWAGDSSPPSRASSELDPLAASDPQLERRQEDRKDGQSYTDGAGIAELASVERGEVDHRGEDLAGVRHDARSGWTESHQRDLRLGDQLHRVQQRPVRLCLRHRCSSGHLYDPLGGVPAEDHSPRADRVLRRPAMAVMSPPPTEAVRIGEARPGRAVRRRGKAGGGTGETIANGFSHLFLLVWGLMVVYPLLWVVLSSFKDDAQVVRQPLSLIPHGLHWENFSRAWVKGHIGSFFFNTIIIVGGGVILTMLLGSMAAYVLARYTFPGNRLIYFMFLSGFTLPIYLAAVPLYQGVYKTGGYVSLLGPNKHTMLTVVYIAWSLSFTIFFMHSFFRTLPTSVAEAALVDGASHTRLFFSVMLPMARPGLISS